MFLTILAAVLMIGAFIATGFKEEKVQTGKDYRGNPEYERTASWGLRKLQFTSLTPIILILIACIAIIPANTVGIQYNPFQGGTQEQTLSEGFHPKSPFTKVYQMSTQVQTKEIGVVEGQAKLAGQTKDAQWLSIAVDIKYRVNSENAYQVFRAFRTLKNVDENLIIPFSQRAIEAVTVNYNIIEILGGKRNEVYTLIEDDLTSRLAGSSIELVSVTFIDTDAGDSIELAIEQEATAKKQVDIAEQERLRAQIDKETKIIEAQATKEQTILNAEAQAEAKVLDAEARAKAIEVIQLQLSKDPTYIEYLTIETWNGILPTVMAGEGTGFMYNIAD